ncbi:MAG: archaellin/type IV pilin N-terminal domain-containing protein [Candidatus Bathyarchaeia archaeon]
MRTIMGKRFTNRGVSVIIAALLLIAIAVAAAVLLYVFSIGLMGSLSSSGGSQTKDQLIMAAYNWPAAGPLVLYVQNVGSSTLNLLVIGGASYFISGILVAATPAGTGGCTTAQAPGSGACQMNLPNPTTITLTSGSAYPIKVVLADGGVFSYSAIYGQSS